MDFLIIMPCKGTDAAGHDVDDGVRNPVLADIAAAFPEGGHVVVDSLGRANLGDVDFEAAGVVELEFPVEIRVTPSTLVSSMQPSPLALQAT